MQPIQDHPLPSNPFLTAKQAKPMVITGSVAIVAGVVGSVAVIVFAAALMPILLPITATVAAAGVICLSIGLHALRMHAKNEAERDRKVAAVKDHIQENHLEAAVEAFDALPKDNQEQTFEDLAISFLETSNDKFKWLLEEKKEALQPAERLALCVKLIELHKEKAKFDAIHFLLEALAIEVEKQKELEIGLCNYYMDQKRFNEALDIAYFYELIEPIKLLFEEFLKIKHVEKLEQILRSNRHDEKIISSWRCKLAALYVDLNEMEKALNMLNPLQLAPKSNNPEFKLYEIVQIRLYSHFKDHAEKAKNAIEGVAFSLAGGFVYSDEKPNCQSMAFFKHLEQNLPPAFTHFCEQALWESAHEVLAQSWEAFKNPPVVEPVQQGKDDDSFDEVW